MTARSIPNSYPLFNYPSLDSPVIYHNRRLITLRQLLKLVEYLSKKIRPHQHILNLYEDRFYFLTCFLLGIKQDSISLFPSTINPHIVSQLKKNYADIIIFCEHEQIISQYKSDSFDLRAWIETFFSDAENQQIRFSDFSDIDPKRQLAIIFTSGSTGQPKAYKKQWADLAVVGRFLAEQFLSGIAADKETVHAVLATVPPQHMYGLESSIIFALQNGMLIYSERPFFPQDIAHCLENLQSIADKNKLSLKTSIITTPLHLKACIKTEVPLTGIQGFISATASLDKELAQCCEDRYSVPVLEIYGCTEVGTIAWRKNTESAQWTVFDDITLKQQLSTDSSDEAEVQLNTSRSIQQFILNDHIELLDQQHFLLKGRKEDLINLAGKRTSLAYLNHHLQSCDALSDGCYYLNEKQQENTTISRLIVFAVLIQKDTTKNLQLISQRQSEQQISQLIRNHLKAKIDPVFLPRKIYFVDSLPRNATGKLPLSQIKELLLQVESAHNISPIC